VAEMTTPSPNNSEREVAGVLPLWRVCSSGLPWWRGDEGGGAALGGLLPLLQAHPLLLLVEFLLTCPVVEMWR
jgi:hypothetical protein